MQDAMPVQQTAQAFLVERYDRPCQVQASGQFTETRAPVPPGGDRAALAGEVAAARLRAVGLVDRVQTRHLADVVRPAAIPVPADLQREWVSGHLVHRELPHVLPAVRGDERYLPDVVPVGVKTGGLGVDEAKRAHGGSPLMTARARAAAAA